MSYICDICNTKTSTRYNLGKHKQSETCQKVKRELEQINKINELTKKNKEQEELINNYKESNHENNLTIITLENKVKTLEELYKKEKEISEQYRKIVEKAATKSTKTINNNNNNNKNTYNHNNYLKYVSNEPIKFSELQQKISNLVTTKTIMFDNDDFNDHITKNMLKDENGKDKILCTDINRKNFTYKDEKSGQMISDPELERLREQLVKGSNNQSIKKDLLDKLIEKYEGTGVDPYNKFYEYMQNIQFGTPFIEHVAKKTYIKTKPDTVEYKDVNIIGEIDDNENLNKLEIEEIEELDRLYHEMKDEFGDE